VRLFIATCLCAIFVGSLLSPLALLVKSDSESNLPACCRRDGKHHCATMAAVTEPAGKRFQAAPEACPFRSDTVSTSRIVSFVPRSAAIVFAEVLSHPTAHEQKLAKLRISEIGNRLKRGPPLTS
jgi:hypothetical protein